MKVSKFSKSMSICALALYLQGCESTQRIVSLITPTDADYSALYLRGSFSWWEADDSYKVVDQGDNVYSVSVELLADGQPYEFKFADKDWSPGMNCGFDSQPDDQILTVNKVAYANCDTPVDNFKFTPEESGMYLFSIEFPNWGKPKVSISRV